MTNLATISEWATILSAAGGAVFYTVRWMVNVNNAVKDINSIKTNHLPHMYYMLGLIANKLGIDYDPTRDIHL